jgi:indolepyruvate ferredoxin oxidoreductase
MGSSSPSSHALNQHGGALADADAHGGESPAVRAFATLVAMRRLRGTWLDPFGHTEVRCTERALITEYRKVVDTLLTGLSEGNHDLAVQIAALPDQIRGYEEIKLATVRTYHEKMAELQAEFAASASPTMVP